MSASESNMALIRRWSEAYESGGFDMADGLVDEIFDPAIEFSPLLAREVEGRTLHGREELRRFFRELQETIGDFRYAPVEYRAVGEDVVVVLTRLLGTGRGSDVPVGQDLGLVYTFENGLIRRLTAYSSHYEAMAEGEAAALA